MYVVVDNFVYYIRCNVQCHFLTVMHTSQHTPPFYLQFTCNIALHPLTNPFHSFFCRQVNLSGWRISLGVRFSIWASKFCNLLVKALWSFVYAMYQGNWLFSFLFTEIFSWNWVFLHWIPLPFLGFDSYTNELLEIHSDDPSLHVLFIPGNPGASAFWGCWFSMLLLIFV